MNMCFHTQTPKNTTLHHPSTHSDNDTDPRHIKSLLFPYTFGSASQLFVLSFATDETISSESASTEAKKLSIEASFVSAGKAPTNTTAEGRSTCRWKVVIRTLELLGEIREFLEDFCENGVKSLHVVSYLQSLRRRDAGEVGAWNWKAHFEHVTCFSNEKIFRIDAVAPGRSFHTFYRVETGTT